MSETPRYNSNPDEHKGTLDGTNPETGETIRYLILEKLTFEESDYWIVATRVLRDPNHPTGLMMSVVPLWVNYDEEDKTYRITEATADEGKRVLEHYAAHVVPFGESA